MLPQLGFYHFCKILESLEDLPVNLRGNEPCVCKLTPLETILDALGVWKSDITFLLQEMKTSLESVIQRLNSILMTSEENNDSRIPIAKLRPSGVYLFVQIIIQCIAHPQIQTC